MMWRAVGHDRVTRQLDSELAKELLHHAYLFTGPARVGKKLVAVDLAMSLNCDNGHPACGECSNCRRILALNHADLQVVDLYSQQAETEGRKSIGVEEIRDVLHSASLPPFEGKSKVFIIDGAELLSISAANCFLKTLEEPPPGSFFILLAGSVDAVIPTLVSRCRHMEFRPVDSDKITQWLAGQMNIGDAKASQLAALSRGRPGWAVQCAQDEGFLNRYIQKRSVMLEILQADYPARLEYARSLSAVFGRDRRAVYEEIDDWQVLVRDLILVKLGLENRLCHFDILQQLKEVASGCQVEGLVGLLTSMNATREALVRNVNPRLALEVMLLTAPSPSVVS